MQGITYAHDTALFATGSNIDVFYKALNAHLARAHEWLEENKLILIANKTRCMLFGVSQKLSTAGVPMHVRLGDALLGQLDNFRYLGQNLDARLTGKCHVKAVSPSVA